MFLVFAALIMQHPPWWNDFKREYKRCGLVFYVEGNPAGDGVLIDRDNRGLLLSSSPKRSRKPIDCIGAWAKKHGLKVRYQRF
jgi:hypothetical protein